MSKHTPGPWDAMLKPKPSRIDHGWRTISQCGADWIVAAPREQVAGLILGHHEANAHLIAAAPELLEASIQFRRSIWTGDMDAMPTIDALRMLDAAIAKAIGEEIE